MGVHGLTTFIDSNDNLLIKNYHLHDTPIIIDASNLVYSLMQQTQRQREDLYGGDMVRFAKGTRCFYNSLHRCKIMPILVMDGAHPLTSGGVSKTDESLRRARERFRVSRKVSATGSAPFVMPAAATNIFRSVSLEMGARMHQCMFEADQEVVRLSHQFKCPVISSDGDFYLSDLPYGLISFHRMDYKHVLENKNSSKSEHYLYIKCRVFKQDNFKEYFPDLDKRCLPLLGILAGNDYNSGVKFESFCDQLPHRIISDNCGLGGLRLKGYKGSQQFRIAKILYYLRGKRLEQVINLICAHYPNRRDLKKVIRYNLQVYDTPEANNFRDELSRLLHRGFYSTHKHTIKSRSELDWHFEESIDRVFNWLENAYENSVLTCRLLDLMHRNTLFIRSNIDDPRLPSAHHFQFRCMRVMLRLARSSKSLEADNRPCEVYDRVGDSYVKLKIAPIDKLELFGPLDYTIFDLPQLPHEERKNILFATFHCTERDFDQSNYYEWFNKDYDRELLTVALMMRFIDRESNQKEKLWPEFKQGVLFCMVYYFTSKMPNRAGPFASELAELIMENGHCNLPNRYRKFNCRLVHQITQLQASIISYNFLNAFLGDVIPRIRSENWLNSCLIYNLVQNLRTK